MNKVLKGVIFAIFSCCIALGFAQKPAALSAQLKSHIETLASDKYEGRETGLKGEMMAAVYIRNEFEEAGLAPLEGNYYQEFGFLAKKEPEWNKCNLSLGGKKIDAGDWTPLVFSASKKAEGELIYLGFGMEAADKGMDNYADKGDLAGKIFIIEMGSPDGVHPHSEFSEHSELRKKIQVAKDKGCAGIVFVNHDKTVIDPQGVFENRINPEDFPVAFLKDANGKMSAADYEAMNGKPGSLEVSILEVRRTGRNVIGELKGGGKGTVIIGAHYDHLGFGDGGGSLHDGEKAIHNGADDNASGTGMLIELARTLALRKATLKYDYLFIAFSGEEKGLLGSNYFAKNSLKTISVKPNYMLNMDMVGRLDPVENTLGINGAGTSPVWKEAFEKVEVPNLKIKTTDSGVGPSDHTSFYLEGMPVLHFFSGTHSDYHKPSDDEELINYEGMEKIFAYMMNLVNYCEGIEPLKFTKTADGNGTNAPRFTVTLGVIPDYLFDGEGMRIDGVRDGKTASKAGIKKGDVVIKMGEYEVKDMMSYMHALSKFQKGQKTKVEVLREGKVKKKKVKF